MMTSVWLYTKEGIMRIIKYLDDNVVSSFPDLRNVLEPGTYPNQRSHVPTLFTNPRSDLTRDHTTSMSSPTRGM
jgi:hypothetical protein